MRIFKTVFAGLSLAFIAAGCATFDVGSDFDRQADFSRLQTYKWVSDTQPLSGNPQIDNSLVDSRIRSAVDKALALKGYRAVTTGVPDFLVSYRAAIRGKMDVTTVNTPYQVPSPSDIRNGTYFGWDWVYGGTETFVSQYEEGSLFIDIVNPATKKLMWRGTGKDAISEKASPEKREARINEVVGKILAQFPPKK